MCSTWVRSWFSPVMELGEAGCLTGQKAYLRSGVIGKYYFGRTIPPTLFSCKQVVSGFLFSSIDRLIVDVQWSELESEMNKLFQDAVKKVPTGDQSYKQIAFCILIPIIVVMFLNQGSKLTKKSSLNFCDRIRKFSRNFAKFIGKIVALCCVVSGLAKQNVSPQYLCKETAENGE